VRPVELRLRNFRSYFGDEAAFDFRDRRLVGIVGPIGSGKSTILDAVSFALYGRTATIGRGTKALIHQRADNAAVAFRFTVDGEVWEVQRMLRRKGASQHALYRLEDDTEGADKLDQITGEVEVTTRVAELLGLDFDAFGRSVLLAQGRFTEFLTARPAERDKVLKGVFGHDRIDRMRTVAKEHAREAEIEAEKATVTVRHLAELEAATATRKEAFAEDESRLASMEKIEPTVRELSSGIESASAEQRAADQTLEELRKAGEGFPNDDELKATVSAALGAVERRSAAARLVEQARSDVEAAERRAGDAAASRETLDAATTLLATAEQRTAAVADAEQALGRGSDRRQQAAAEAAGQGDRVALAEREAGKAEIVLAEGTAALVAAEGAYHEAVHTDMAASLRRELHEGEPCPVCEQPVPRIPEGPDDGADVDAALALVQAARDRRTKSEETNTTASGALASAKTAQEDATRRKTEAEFAVEDFEEHLSKASEAATTTSGELISLLASRDVDGAVAALRDELAGAASAMDAAAVARDRARADHDTAIAAEQAANKRLADLRVVLAGVAARVDDAPSIGDGAEAVAEAAVILRAIVEQALHDARKRREQAESVAEDQQKALEALLIEAGITGSFDEALAGLRSRVEVLREEITRADQQLEGRAEEVARRDTHVAAMKTYQALAGDLTDARFVRFLLDDERRHLAELGSDHFQRLTNGRYRFTDDGAFDIVDLTSADTVRKADSLSGGETFLASLGLALALAEIVARGGGRLDAFFLDEGFGTLDPEHLDLAMEGIESLVSEDGSRLVVVVSHVPELRHRVEDLIELDRNPTTGDTRVLSA